MYCWNRRSDCYCCEPHCSDCCCLLRTRNSSSSWWKFPLHWKVASASERMNRKNVVIHRCDSNCTTLHPRCNRLETVQRRTHRPSETVNWNSVWHDLSDSSRRYHLPKLSRKKVDDVPSVSWLIQHGCSWCNDRHHRGNTLDRDPLFSQNLNFN